MSSATEQPPLRVIGIGSPFGGDAAGLHAIDLLRDEHELFPAGTELLALDRPGSNLIPLLETARHVILIDAMQSGQPAGTVQQLELKQLLAEASLPSSHNIGVAESLALADALGVLPKQLTIIGIEARIMGEGAHWYAELQEHLRRILEQMS